MSRKRREGRAPLPTGRSAKSAAARWTERALALLKRTSAAGSRREDRREGLVAEAVVRADALLSTDPSAAVGWAEAAIRIASEGPGGASEDASWRARRLHAKALHAAGRWSEALASLTTLGRRRLPAGRRADVESTKAALLARLGRMDDAVSAIGRARRAFRAAGDRLGMAHVDINEGNLRHRQDRHARALQLYRRARRVLLVLPRESSKGREHDLGLCELGLGNVLTYSRDVQGAADAYARAIAHFDSAGSAAARSVAAYNAAYLELLAGRPQAALDGLATVRVEFAARGEARGVANCDLDRAEVSLFLGIWPEAEAAARAALAATEALGMQTESARARLHLARALAATSGSSDASPALLQEAERIFEAESNAAGAATARLLRAEAALREGRPEQAIGLAREAAATLRRHGLPGRAALALSTEARSLLQHAADAGSGVAVRRLARARAMGALKLARPGDWAGISSLQVLARLDLEAGDERAARRRAGHAMDAVERLGDGLRSDAARACLLGEYDESFALGASAWLAGTAPRPEKAFECAERARRFALLLSAPVGGPTGHATRAAQAFVVSGAAEGARRLARERRPSGRDRSRPAGYRRAQLPSVQESALDAARVARTPASYLLGSLAAVQARLRGGDVLVQMIRVHGGSGRAAFVVTRDSMRFQALAEGHGARRVGARLLAAAERAAFVASVDPAAALLVAQNIADAASRMAELVLSPLAADLADATRLLVVPDPDLASLPWGLLPWKGSVLGQQIDVVQLPSASWILPRGFRGRAQTSLVAFGVGDDAAPHAEQEARDVAGTAASSILRTGREATREAFRLLAPRARILHVACHGAFRADAPWQSAIRLADGWLSAHEIEAIPLRCEVAVLSACQGGALRSAGSGAQLLGPVRALLRAGARRVIASPWTVPDRVAHDLFTRFHEVIARGADVGVALREAQASASPKDQQVALSFGHFGAP